MRGPADLQVGTCRLRRNGEREREVADMTPYEENPYAYLHLSKPFGPGHDDGGMVDVGVTQRAPNP